MKEPYKVQFPFYRNRLWFRTVRELVNHSEAQYADLTFCIAEDGKRTYTYKELVERVRCIGGWMKKNIGTAHVAILGGTSFSWIATYLGALYHGVVIVVLDALLDSETLLKQIKYTDVNCLFYDLQYRKEAQYIREHSDACNVYVSLDGADEFSLNFDILSKSINSYEMSDVSESSLAEIVFTSGTTGISKGVMLSQKNIMSSVIFCCSIVDIKPGSVELSFLPNNHTYEQMAGIFVPMYFGFCIVLEKSIFSMQDSLLKYKPNLLVVVPAILQVMKREIQSNVRKLRKEKELKLAIQIWKVCRLFGIDIRKRLFSDIYDKIGGELEFIFCGGAHLDYDTEKFFRNIGITIIEGYGITECSPLVACNTDRFRLSGTLGKAGPCCRVKSVDGELWVSGDNVMLGYYKNPQQTESVMEGQWFKTGDLVDIYPGDWLKLRGRKKNLIILSNGENVCPEELENMISSLDIIADVIVYEEKGMIAACIFPQKKYLSANCITDTYSDIKKQISFINKKLPSYKRIQIIHLCEEPFEKTNTMKIKRFSTIEKMKGE